MRAVSTRTIHTLAATPLLWVAWFYLYVIRQRIHLGFWPQPYRPDPKDADYAIHHLSIYLGWAVIPVIPFVVIGLIAHRQSKDARFKGRLALGLLALSYACYWTVVHVDPGQYWEWFLD
ncbi:MAG: hypothetical protein HC780_13940 [Leptolyngbyaceae cyanobacterium CSU_1_3]|nr:hypothetical protein [Leptolyngbyaceae cyanobacterium CSU_1_3]